MGRDLSSHVWLTDKIEVLCAGNNSWGYFVSVTKNGKKAIGYIEKQNSEIINNKYDDKGKIEIEEYNRINYQKLKNKSIRSLSDIKKNSISNLTTKENNNTWRKRKISNSIRQKYW